MIGAIIGMGMQVAGGIAGNIAARKQAKKQAQILAAEKAKNQAWYNRKYNEDATQRADAQAALTRMREVMKERTANAAGTAAVMGGSEAAVAAEKEAQNKALAGATSNIVAQGEARKDAIEEQFMERDSQITSAQNEMEAQKAGGIASAIAGIAGAAGGVAGGIDTVFDEERKKQGGKS